MSDPSSSLKIHIYPTIFPLCFDRLWNLCFNFPNHVPEDVLYKAEKFLLSQASQANSNTALFEDDQEKKTKGTQSQDKLDLLFKSGADLCLLQIFDYAFRAITFLEEQYGRSLFQRTYICTHYNHHIYLPFGPAQKIIEVMHKNKVIVSYEKVQGKDPYYMWHLKGGQTYLEIFNPFYSPFGKKDIPLKVTYQSGYACKENFPPVYQNRVYELIRLMINNGGSLPQLEEIKLVFGSFPKKSVSGLVFNRPSNDLEMVWPQEDWA